MDSRIVNALEMRLGMDLNGDGYIGGEGYMSMLERATGRDINGDGRLGRGFDVVPGFPAVYGNPTYLYGQTGVVATNQYVPPQTSYPSQYASQYASRYPSHSHHSHHSHYSYRPHY